MKTLKVSLTIIVIAAIASGVFFWIQRTSDPQKTKPPENQFTRKIEKEIEQLKVKPEYLFCKDFYILVMYNISEFHKKKAFSTNTTENNRWKLNLESNLYVAYANKFIKQSKAVFGRNDWENEDLKFIQSEKNQLKNSKFLFSGSLIEKELNLIQTALDKYNEISYFIASCEEFDYSNTDLSARFPIADVQSKMYRSSSLITNRLENNFVINCSRLQVRLKGIPLALMKKHIWYLDNKINNSTGNYSQYQSYNDYSIILYRPLKSEIEDFRKVDYSISSFDSEYTRLLDKLNSDNRKAYNFSYPQ